MPDTPGGTTVATLSLLKDGRYHTPVTAPSETIHTEHFGPTPRGR
jgi:hypothetical protein